MTPSAVIDTHAAIWYLNADLRLSDRARRFIDEAGRRGVPVLISSISLVEVVYLCEKGRVPPASIVRLEEALRIQDTVLRVADLTIQLGALHKEIAAEEEVWREERHAARVALEEARARHREAEVAARSEETELFARLQARGLPAQLDLLRAQAEAHKRRAATETLRLAVSRLEGDQRAREGERKARLERLRREVTRLDGETATTRATIERLEHEIDRRRIRAQVLGILRRRWADLGVIGPTMQRILEAALADPAWHPLATLDAASRLVNTIVCLPGSCRWSASRAGSSPTVNGAVSTSPGRCCRAPT
jgi:PIN domain nuclease of toxin-antitoxin system